jgi:type II secretory pathway component HofQ
VSDSILTTIKKTLGMDESYEAFDTDVLLHINSVLSTLNQIGVGPENGFQIEDASATWDEFLGSDPSLNNVKGYMALKVRMLFDPPSTSFVIAAVEANIKEYETRIYLKLEADKWQ